MKGSRTPRSEGKVVVAGCRGSGCCPTIYWDREGLMIVVPPNEIGITTDGRRVVRIGHATMRKVIEQAPDPSCIEYVSGRKVE
jgi:hypothetical protein